MPKIAAGATNKNISLAPNGTGKVVVGTGAADATVQSDGDHNLILQTGNSTTSKIEITDGANGDVAITPNGTGNLTIDNIAISDNAITSTDTNGNIDLTPNGTGEVNISKVDIDGGAIDGTNVTVGSGKTLDVSAGTLTSSTAQKQAIVDGAAIEGDEILATGESGTFLGADGDDSSSWKTITGTLPSQTGNAEKILKTSGSAASWTATRKLIASTDGIQRSDATAVLSEDGSNVATLDNVTLGSSAVFPAGHIVQIVGNEVNTVTTPSDDGAVSIVSKAITTKRAGSHFLLLGQTNFGQSSGTPNVRAYFRRCLPGVAFASGNDLGAFTDGNREGGIGGAQHYNSLEGMANISIDWVDSSASYTVGDVITYHLAIGVRDTACVINRIGSTGDNNFATRTYTTIRILEIGQ